MTSIKAKGKDRRAEVEKSHLLQRLPNTGRMRPRLRRDGVRNRRSTNGMRLKTIGPADLAEVLAKRCRDCGRDHSRFLRLSPADEDADRP